MRATLRWAVVLLALLAAACAVAAAASPISQQFAAAAASRGAASSSTLLAASPAAVAAADTQQQQPGLLSRVAAQVQSVHAQATQFKNALITDKVNAFDALVHDLFPASKHGAFARLTGQPQQRDASLPGLRVPTRRSKIVVGEYNLTPAQKAAVEEAFFTDPKSLAMRNQSPRFGPSEPKFSASGEEQKDPYGVGISAYVWGLLMCFLIGLVIAWLQLIFTCVYMFFRCCCWRWCCKKRSDWEKPGFGGYPTFLSKYWPVLFLAAFLALACTFAIVGIVFNNGVSKTFSTSDPNHGIAPLMIATMDGLQGWVGRILGSVQDIIDYVGSPTLTGAISGLTTQVGDLSTGTAALGTQTTAFGTAYGGANPSATGSSDASALFVLANGTQYHCDVTCVGLGTAATTMGGEITNQVDSQFSSYTDVINAVESSFLDVASDITSKLTDATGGLNDAQSQVSDPKRRKTITDNSESVEKVDKQRNLVFLIIFSLVFLSPVITALGLLTKRSCPFKLSFVIGPFYLWLVWILFGLHWMLGMTIGDTCVYLDNSMLNLASTMSSLSDDSTAASVLNACLTNTSLIVALNLTSQLDFADLIQFPVPLDANALNQTFSFAGFDTIQSQVGALTPLNFNFDENAVVDQTLATMNTYPATAVRTINRAEILGCGPPATGCYLDYPVGEQPRMEELHTYAYQGIQIATAIHAQIATIRADVGHLDSNITALQQKLNDTIRAVSDSSNPASMQALLQPVLDTVHGFENDAYCYFAAQSFGDFKNTFCDQLQYSIQFMTLALFLIGLSCFGITWCSRWSSYRVSFVHKVAPMPASMFDEGAWMQQATGSAGAGYAAGQGGVQLAQMGEEGQYHDGHAMASPSAPHDGAYVASNSAGGALPPYAAALAAYDTPAQPSAEEQAAAQQWQETEQGQLLTGAEAAPSEATGAAVGSVAAAAAVSSPSGAGCQSCEKEAASIRCAECEESLCAACDEALHKTEANAGHNRTAM